MITLSSRKVLTGLFSEKKDMLLYVDDAGLVTLVAPAPAHDVDQGEKLSSAKVILPLGHCGLVSGGYSRTLCGWPSALLGVT